MFIIPEQKHESKKETSECVVLEHRFIEPKKYIIVKSMIVEISSIQTR